MGTGMGMGPRYMEPQRMEHRRAGMRAGFLFSAFAFGALVGGTLGLLFAPRRGSEIREALAENMAGRGITGEYRRKVEQALASGRASASDLINQTQRELDELRSQAVSRLGDAKLRARILQKQAELRYLQGRERLRRM